MNEIISKINDISAVVGAEVVRTILGLIGVLVVVVVNALVMTWVERKVSGHMQRRIGPKEVGPYGLLQPIVDGIKLVAKDIITPKDVKRPLYFLAPVIIFIPVLVCFVVIPFDAYLQVKDINVGILVIFAFSSLSVLSLLLAGWGSNNKYSLVGAMRSVAQNIAYEIPLLLSLLPILFMCNSFSLKDVVEAQKGAWFILYHPIPFLIYFIAGVAETNRTPFDLPEGESELVAGFHTEYSGMRFALFFLAEYSNMFIISAVATTFFLGGYQGPILPGFVWFFIKAYILLFIIVWFRWTWPRVRFDQLLNFSWKVLIPVSFIWLLITGGMLKIL